MLVIEQEEATTDTGKKKSHIGKPRLISEMPIGSDFITLCGLKRKVEEYGGSAPSCEDCLMKARSLGMY